MTNLQRGQRVKYIGSKIIDRFNNRFFPPVGTIGIIADVGPECTDGGNVLLVQWPKGTTFSDDMWYVGTKFVELVDS